MMQVPLIQNLNNAQNNSILNSSSNVNMNNSNSEFMATLVALNDVDVNHNQEEGLTNLETTPMDELLQSIITELLSLDLSKLNELINAEISDEEENFMMIEQWLEESGSKQSFLTIVALFNQLSTRVEELSLQGKMTDNYGGSSFELVKLIMENAKNQSQNLPGALQSIQSDENSNAKPNLSNLFEISTETLELMNKLMNDTEKRSPLQFFQLFNVISKTTATDLGSMDVMTDRKLSNLLLKTLKAYQTNPSEYFKSVQNEQTLSGRIEQQTPLINQIVFQTNVIPDDGMIPSLGNQNVGAFVNNDVVQTTTVEVVKQPMEAQKFAQEMSQFVFKTIRFSQFNGIAEARISLVPEQLGQVDVHIKLENGQLVTQFMVDKLIGKEMIESQLPQLRLALQNLGIQVDKVEVVQMESASSSQLFQGETNQQFSQQYKQQDQNSDKYDNFLANFQDDDLEMDMLTQGFMKTSGRGFDVTA